MFKNSYLRLLMSLCGFKLLGPASEETPESSWIVPDDISADHLKDSLHFINQAEFSPPTFDDGVLAEHQLKRKTVSRKKAAFDEDEDGELDDELLFPAGGPTVRKAVDAPKKTKKTRRIRRKGGEEESDDEALDEKARKRRDRELEKMRRIKSALYVRDGDDEFDSDEDEAFFARERAIADRAKEAAKSATGLGDFVALPKKRKSDVLLTVSDDDDLIFAQKALSSQEGADASETDDTPVDISEGEGRKRRKVSADPDDEETTGEDDDVDMEASAAKSVEADKGDEDVDDAPVVVARRPRVRGGFIVDSDDDE